MKEEEKVKSTVRRIKEWKIADGNMVGWERTVRGRKESKIGEHRKIGQDKKI